MRRKNPDGTDYLPELETQVDANQSEMVDALTTPHPKMGESLGSACHIVSRVPAYEPDAQPVQARGRVLWNRAYAFQPHGPSYLDPVPDPRS